MAEKLEDTVLTGGNTKNESEQRSQSAEFTANTVAGTDDLSEFVHNILKSTQSQFETMSNKIINRIDDVSRRVDELEKSIADLMKQTSE